MYTSAFTIGVGYLVGGFIPLVPYFFISRAHVALLYSSLLTGTPVCVHDRFSLTISSQESFFSFSALSSLA
jgi:VIT1/CCC1 family predicted Fe2+/Mn2+ transporter